MYSDSCGDLGTFFSQEALGVAAHSPIDVAFINSNVEEQPKRGFDVLQELRTLHLQIHVIHAAGFGERGVGWTSLSNKC
jgi:hypothetical protein